MYRRSIAVLALVIILALPIISVASATAGTYTGTTVPMPADKEAEQLETAQDYADAVGADLPTNATMFYTDSGETFVLATDTTPKTAKATVSGQVVSEPSEEFAGLIIASEVEYDRRGDPVSLSELSNNPEAYNNEYVAVHGSVRQIAYSMDPAGNEYVLESSMTTLAKPHQQPSLLTSPGRTSRSAVRDISESESSGAVRLAGQPKLETLGASSQEHRWTGRGNATVHAVVKSTGDGYILQVGRIVYDTEYVGSVQELDQHRGEIVTVHAQAIGTRISGQEAIIQTARCAPSSATFPPTGCIPVPADSVVHTGMAFEGVPESRDSTVVYVGASNREQSRIAAPEHGQYELTGRVVSASSVDPRLEGTALLVYDRSRMGGLTVTDESRNRVNSWQADITANLIQQMQSTDSEWRSTKQAAKSTPTATPTPTDTATPEPTPTEAPEPDVAVQRVSITQSEIEYDQTTGIRVTAVNNGGSGHAKLSVDANGDTLTESAHFAAGERKTVTIGFNPPANGSYLISHNGEHVGTVEVRNSGTEQSLLDRAIETLPMELILPLTGLSYIFSYGYATFGTIDKLFGSSGSYSRSSIRNAWLVTGVLAFVTISGFVTVSGLGAIGLFELFFSIVVPGGFFGTLALSVEAVAQLWHRLRG